MIPAEIIKKIKRIHIKSSRTVNTIMAGQYKSVFRGSGMEFEEVREYSPGDEVKSIDWKVSARLGKPYIKLFKEERESIVMLLIDMSLSQKFGTFHGQKVEKAAQIASVLAFNAIKNNDKVGAIFFTDHVEKYIPPKKGSGHIWRLIKEIFTFVPSGKKTDISSALDYLSKVSRKKTISFVLSDFLDKNYFKSLKTVRQKHELIGILLSDPGDFKLPEKGIIRLCDLETSSIVMMDAYHKKTRELYKTANKIFSQAAIDNFAKAKSDIIQMNTDSSVSETLTKYFRQRERRIR